MFAFTSTPFGLAAGAVFSGLLAAACISDVRSRRIPNTVVLILALTGLVVTALSASSVPGAFRGLATLGLGFAIWIPLYALRMLGAGDVKLFAGASAWLAPLAVMNAALLTALIGAVLGLVWMFRSYGGALAVARLSHAALSPSVLRESLPDDGKAAKVPYGVAMALGLSLAAWLPGFPF